MQDGAECLCRQASIDIGERGGRAHQGGACPQAWLGHVFLSDDVVGLQLTWVGWALQACARVVCGVFVCIGGSGCVARAGACQ